MRSPPERKSRPGRGGSDLSWQAFDQVDQYRNTSPWSNVTAGMRDALLSHGARR